MIVVVDDFNTRSKNWYKNDKKLVTKMRITLNRRYTAANLLWTNAVGLVDLKNIYFWCKVHLSLKVKKPERDNKS